MNTHEGKYICGYCKKETSLEDELLIDFIGEGKSGPGGLKITKPICSCGHLSYASSISFKAEINPKDWQGWYRGSAE